MIALINGTVIEREAKALIVDVRGVGYRITVLASVRDKVRKGDSISLRTHHHVSDDGQALYGFEHVRDLDFFELLLTVPSVGPRTAMGILEVAPPDLLAQAVAEEDATLLTKVSGVGKKTAHRILVELAEKIEAPAIRSGVSGAIQHETVEALVSIGYTKQQAQTIVQQLPKNVESVEEAVRAALRQQ